EKAKLKAYVTGGGTILGQACCSKAAFERSFRELVEELFGAKLETVPAEHPVYTRMKTRGLAPRPKVEVIALADQGGRPGVIYLDRDHCCRWHVGVSQEAFAVGTGIYLYVTTDARKMFERSRDAAAK
ncbi:MAG TPA: DUF4159 domain-containing protein, partial [Planctomycetota bacterium]|nr:DUF4159 domain-containing protein [Planctomycetota bacterium]